MSLRRPFVSRIQAVRSWGTAEIMLPGFHPDGKWLVAPPMSVKAAMGLILLLCNVKGYDSPLRYHTASPPLTTPRPHSYDPADLRSPCPWPRT